MLRRVCGGLLLPILLFVLMLCPGAFCEAADWTVDYHRGDRVYSVPGGQSASPEEIFEALGLPDGADARVVSFSAPDKLGIEDVDGETRLTGLIPFDTEERLTVLLADGTLLTIRVTDAQNEARSDITEYYYFSNDSEMGSVKLTDSKGNTKNPSASDGYGSVLNSYGTTSNLFCVPVAESGYRFVGWTNEGAAFTTYTAVSGGGYTYASYAIRPNKTKADHTTNMFTANFVANDQYLIMLQSTEGGAIVALSDTGYTLSDGTPYAVSTADVNKGVVVARANAGYRFVRWQDASGNTVTSDDVLNTNGLLTQDVTYTAVFEEITDARVTYQTDPARGSVSQDEELAPIGGTAQGATATAKAGFTFVGWFDENGLQVSSNATYVPTGNAIHEGAAYTALFESASYNSYLRVRADDANHGYIVSPDYENTVSGYLAAMYVREDGALPATIEAVAYEDYIFDHWELNGTVVTRLIDGAPTPLGETLPGGFDVSAYLTDGEGWNELVAVYAENPNAATHTITYAVLTDGQGAITNTSDTWRGGRAEGIQGSTATAATNYKFGGWVERMDNGNYRVVANSVTPTLLPAGDLLHDATYYAVFTPGTGGWVGYNMNLSDADVTWEGVQDWVISSAAGAPMYYSSHSYSYFGETFTLDSHMPSADGYYFIGWFDKDRPATSGESKVNGLYSVGPYIYTRSDIAAGKALKFTFAGTGGSRYTLEALWAGIDVNSMRVPYDGNEHTITFEKIINVGTLLDTPRYAQEINKFLADDKFYITKTTYQLLDENGEPVGEPVEADHFTQTLPGTWNLRVTAVAMLNGESVTMTKDAYLIIYPAQVIINKIWVDWYDVTGLRPDEDAFDVRLYQNGTYVDASGASGIENTEEPEWTQTARDKWTKTYPLVLVRPEGYGSTDQDSGYYAYTATETVPEWYYKVSESRVVSEDRLTTTITFVNRILQTRIAVRKTDAEGAPLEGASFLLEMVKNADGEAPNEAIAYELSGAEAEQVLYNGYYRMTETAAPAGRAPLSGPIYFCALSTEEENIVYLTDENFQRIDSVEGVTLTREGTFVFTVINEKAPVTATIQGQKRLRNAELTEGRFRFVIQPIDENGEAVGDPITCANDAEGRFSHTFTYTEEQYLENRDDDGVARFCYLVTEQIPEGAEGLVYDSIYYDDAAYLVTVEVKNEDGEQTSTVTVVEVDS